MTTSYGPNSAAIATFIELCSQLTVQDLQRIASCDVPREMRDAQDSHLQERHTLRMSAAFRALVDASTATPYGGE